MPQEALYEQLVRDFSGHLRVHWQEEPEPAVVLRVLQGWLEQIRAAWPNLELDWTMFIGHAAQQLPTEAPFAEVARSWHIADLALAFACAKGDSNALSAFDRLYAGELRAAAAKVRDARDLDEAKQLVWQRLFVGDGHSPPRILNYSGRGPLRAWYRVALVRVLIDGKRQLAGQHKTLEEHRQLGVGQAALDPETEYFKHLYRQHFEQALELASQQLEPSERNILRAYYVENLNVDQLAVAFGMHRATAARKVSRARERLLELTRASLQQRLTVSDAELESILRLIRSRLQVSIRRLLETK